MSARITGQWLQDPALSRILRLLSDHGAAALIVGGAVRNSLLGQAISDIDLATDAPPQRVMALAAEAGMRAIPTGLDHGTVTLALEGQSFEITTFRRDIATDGRHAEIAFTPRMDEDAARRDFTINALYATPEGRVIDPTGGLADLRARRLRFVGDPDQRIREDYLRILRLYRFWAQYGDPDPARHAPALAAVRAHVAGLAQVSRERIGAEMRKLLAAPDPAPMLAEMTRAGALAQILPGADPAPLPALIAAERACAAAPAALRRLAVLGGDDSTAALRLSRAETRRLRDIQSGRALPPAEAGYRLGAETGQDALLAGAASGRPLPEGWHAELTRGAGAQFPIRAADLAPLSGPALGARLRDLERIWLRSNLRASRAELLGAHPA